MKVFFKSSVAVIVVIGEWNFVFYRGIYTAVNLCLSLIG